MPNYKLTYFNSRGKAETIRMLFAEANVQYEDNRLDRANWPNLKPTMPFGQVPVLEVDGKVLPQSKAIAKYVAKELHLDGKNSLEAAFCDAYVEGVDDVARHMMAYRMEKDPQKKEELYQKFKEEHAKPFLDRYEKFLSDNGSGFFVGQSLTWADIYIYDALLKLKSKDAQAIEQHPKLKAFITAIESRPNIKNWIEKRPVTEM